MVEPQLGDFGLVRTPDLGGRLIRIGTDSWMNHAVVYVGNGAVVEARPSGAGYNTVAAYANKGYHLTWSTGLFDLTDEQRNSIVESAINQATIRVPYSWLDIAALGLHIFHIPVFGWVKRRITRSDRLICSQLVDKDYSDSGEQLFDDGRLPQDVTPGDLWNLILERQALLAK